MQNQNLLDRLIAAVLAGREEREEEITEREEREEREEIVYEEPALEPALEPAVAEFVPATSVILAPAASVIALAFPLFLSQNRNFAPTVAPTIAIIFAAVSVVNVMLPAADVP